MSFPARSVTWSLPGLLLAALLAIGAAPALADRSERLPWQQDQQGTQKQASEAKPDSLTADDAVLEAMLSKHVLVSYDSLRTQQNAIDQYQAIVAKGGWPAIGKGRTLRVGDRDELVIPLRRRLQLTDGLSRDGEGSWVYDEEVAAAVGRFQFRHGIPPTGILDRRTIAALNVPAGQRLNQLRLNLQRMRELLVEPLPGRYVIVNVPGFELQAIENGRVALSSRVIVGRPERQTPTVRAKIKGLNFFPYWNVPDSVAHLDLIPKLEKDPGYLQREGIRVMTDWKGTEVDPRWIDWRAPEAQTLRFRQDPGERNALGLVRIDMPNEHAVYMHDTPMKNLFSRSARAFSAGCVRVHRVFDLVAWLASANGDWDRARVDSVLIGGFAEDVKLNEFVDVYFVYLTAWATPLGEVHFRPDYYGRDGTEDPSSREDREGLALAANEAGSQSLAP